MSSEQQPQPSEAGAQGPGGPTSQAQPSEDELRAAYEAELNRISSAEMIIQTTVSLINIAGRRLGLAPAAGAGEGAATPDGERDLEQVRDAIDGASALMPILERRMPGELRPLRDAIAQLQVAYAREAQGSASTSQPPASTSTNSSTSTTPASPTKDAQQPAKPDENDRQPAQGPAQSSGRLWVPGR
ncbi:MAG TPA: hypothetical protein VIJ50_00725 [Solirubrobacteraceae bacterium]